MAKRLIILGAGGFAREVADVVRDLGPDAGVLLLGFADRDRSRAGVVLHDSVILGQLADVPDLEGAFGVAGAGEVASRKRQVTEMIEAGLEPLTLVHPTVVMSPFATVGAGSIITAGTIITNNVVIGEHVVVNIGATVGHDVVIGDHCVISPGVHVSGWVHIEEECYIGTGAVLLPRVTIGRSAIVGAGAVVTSDVAPGTTVVGIPARPLTAI